MEGRLAMRWTTACGSVHGDRPARPGDGCAALIPNATTGCLGMNVIDSAGSTAPPDAGKR